jgi:hypothetical protein
MRNGLVNIGLLVLACKLLLPDVAHAQAATSRAVQSTAACINDPGELVSFSDIEKDPDVISAAEGLANTIVGIYDANGGKRADLGSRWLPFNLLVLRKATAKCLQQPEEKAKTQAAKAQATTGSTNNQVGANSSSSGSTSAVQKVGIPQLLGIAIENGAITNSVSGTTMTLSTTPYGFVYAFAKNEDTQSHYEDSKILTQLGISAAFNVANSSDPLQSATRKAVSDWQAKFTFRDTSARSNDAWRKYEEILSPWAGQAMAIQSTTTLSAAADMLTDPANSLYASAWNSTNSTLKAAVSARRAATDTDGSAKSASVGKEVLHFLEGSQYQQALLGAEQSFAANPSLFDLLQKLSIASAGYSSQVDVFNTAVKNLTKGLNGDLLFGENFPTSTTTTSTSSTTASTVPAYLVSELDVSYVPASRIVPKSGVGGALPTYSAVDPSKWLPTITANFIGSFYTDPKPRLNEQTFRGGKVAVMSQWDLAQGPFKKLMSANDKSKMTIALSSSYERLQENAGQKGKKADMVLGNFKLSVPLPGGVSFPLAVSFANATSQVKGNYVVGNFGISFNLDALASLIKANQ